MAGSGWQLPYLAAVRFRGRTPRGYPVDTPPIARRRGGFAGLSRRGATMASQRGLIPPGHPPIYQVSRRHATQRAHRSQIPSISSATPPISARRATRRAHRDAIPPTFPPERRIFHRHAIRWAHRSQIPPGHRSAHRESAGHVTHQWHHDEIPPVLPISQTDISPRCDPASTPQPDTIDRPPKSTGISPPCDPASALRRGYHQPEVLSGLYPAMVWHSSHTTTRYHQPEAFSDRRQAAVR